MVMDVSPSPQSVGREFVRQYYTLLNKAPDYLHRFYNTNSSFVHGGLDAHNREAVMVIGQKQIFDKIKQLKFRDCHAKISQVDAQSTLGNGVVVQVTGELSNDGQPMRRFTQTFVLGMQTPKKYYVHNDIFRYQDLYSEEDECNENGTVNGDEPDLDDAGGNAALDGQQQQQLAGQQQQQLYFPGAGGQQPIDLQSAAPAAGYGQLNGGVAKQPDANAVALQQQQQQQQQLAQQQAAAAASQQQLLLQQQQAAAQAAAAAAAAAAEAEAQLHEQKLLREQQAAAAEHDATNDRGTETEHKDEPSADEHVYQAVEPDAPAAASVPSVQSSIPAVVHAPPSKIVPAEPKTYANLFKTDVSFAAAMANSPALGSVSTSHSASTAAGSAPTNQQQRYTLNRNDPRPGETVRSSGSGGARPVRSQERRPSTANQQQQQPQSSNQQPNNNQQQQHPSHHQQYSDNQQLYIGNIPHQASEDELYAIFGKYGKVASVRIFPKANFRSPNNRPSQPNSAFVTYDDAESVQNCLAHLPVYYPDNATDGLRLNVEEKKARVPGGLGGPRDDRVGRSGAPGGTGGPRMGGNGNNNGNARPQQQQQQNPPPGGNNGPRGPPRGGGSQGFNRNESRRGPASGGQQRGGGNGGGNDNGPQSNNGNTNNNNYGRRQ